MAVRQTVSVRQACEMVGVSRRTLHAWIQHGKVEMVRTAGGSPRVFVDTLYRTPTGERVEPGQERAFAVAAAEG